jgi:hypothetical protein
MKLGTKSHLISAYSALFTVAVGVVLWDFVRRTSSSDEPKQETASEGAKTAPVAKTGNSGSLAG